MIGRKTIVVLFCSILLSCCAEGPVEPEQLQEDFNESLSEFDDLMGIHREGSADLFGNLDEDPCDYLSELVDDQGEMVPYGYFVGVQGELGILFARGLMGVDVVWDLYHYQMGTSYYFGGGVGSLSGSVTVEFYTGVAQGFQTGVNDWNGWFVSSELGVGLPFLNDSLTLGVASFVSAIDADESLFIDPTELLAPPQGVYGYQYIASLGFDLMVFLPDPDDVITASIEITQGRWFSFRWLNRVFFNYLENSNLYLFGEELSVHLVNADTGEECSEDWPTHDEVNRCVTESQMLCDPEDPTQECLNPANGETCQEEPTCVLEFGERDWDHQRRTQHMFYALCWLTGQCAVPSGYHMAQASIAAAVLRDSGMTYAEMCPSGDPSQQ